MVEKVSWSVSRRSSFEGPVRRKVFYVFGVMHLEWRFEETHLAVRGGKKDWNVYGLEANNGIERPLSLESVQDIITRMEGNPDVRNQGANTVKNVGCVDDSHT